MQAYELRGYGLDTLARTARPTLLPGAGEVLVRVRAVSLNYRDWVIAEDRTRTFSPRRPLIPVSDAAGEVVEIGAGVSSIAKGDRVVASFFQGWLDGPMPATGSSALGGARDGALAEYVLLNAEAAIRVPESISLEQAATLPCAAVTAWVGLVKHGKLKSGDTVLALGTGGVSSFATQIAKAHGARVILTSSSAAKLERARAAGVDECIHTEATPDWAKYVLELTDGKGVDHCVEVGGAETVGVALRAMRSGGSLSLVGLLSGSAADVSKVQAQAGGVRVNEFFVGSARDLALLVDFVAEHKLPSIIDRIFPFEEAIEAYRHLGRGAHFGKVAISV